MKCHVSMLHNRTCSQYITHVINRKFKEITIPVPWGHLAGKWWEPYDSRPVLTLHGWQDNCSSFDKLIPLLRNDVGFLALDLPGHGYSSRVPLGVYYGNNYCSILIKMIAKYYKWEKVSLMSHSLGAVNSFVYALLFPNDVDFIVLIEGLKPLIKKQNISRMATGIEDFLKYNEIVSQSKNEPPSYSLDQIKNVMCKLNNNSIDIENVDIILKRNLAKSKVNPDKYYFTRDPRLKSQFVPNWCQHEIVEFCPRVSKIPICLIKASDGGYFEQPENFKEVLEMLTKLNAGFEFHCVKGTHHVHLNQPDIMNEIINNFLGKHINRYCKKDISRDANKK